MPKNRRISFSVPFQFKNWSRAKISKCPAFLCSKILKCPIFPIWFCTWSILKLKKNRKWNSSIFGHFKILSKCYHMTKSSFTCFLGHFILPPLTFVELVGVAFMKDLILTLPDRNVDRFSDWYKFLSIYEKTQLI